VFYERRKSAGETRRERVANYEVTNDFNDLFAVASRRRHWAGGL